MVLLAALDERKLCERFSCFLDQSLRFLTGLACHSARIQALKVYQYVILHPLLRQSKKLPSSISLRPQSTPLPNDARHQMGEDSGTDAKGQEQPRMLE